MNQDFNLCFYFERIGYRGPVEHSFPELRKLVFQHASAIAFGNLDVLTRTGASPDVGSVL